MTIIKGMASFSDEVGGRMTSPIVKKKVEVSSIDLHNMVNCEDFVRAEQ
jgi:hypothetical protein